MSCFQMFFISNFPSNRLAPIVSGTSSFSDRNPSAPYQFQQHQALLPPPHSLLLLILLLLLPTSYHIHPPHSLLNPVLQILTQRANESLWPKSPACFLVPGQKSNQNQQVKFKSNTRIPTEQSDSPRWILRPLPVGASPNVKLYCLHLNPFRSKTIMTIPCWI